MLSKFSGITYPIFVLKKKPVQIEYTTTKIYIKKEHGSHLELLDDKTQSGDYFSRLAKLEKRVDFDYTCTNIRQLIASGGLWGVDSACIPHDFTNKEYVQADKRKVVKVKNNYIWVYKISYPFKIETNEVIELQDDTYAILIKINGEWLIKEFTYDSSPVKKRILL